MRTEIKVMLGIGAVVVAGAVALFVAQPTPATPGEPVDASSLIRENSHMTGSKDATVTIVEFGDYECPACAQTEPLMEQLRTEYQNNPQVNFVFRHYPLAQHKKALAAAEVAEAAGEQGKYWEMHHLLYQHQGRWVGNGDHQALFIGFAQELGLDVAAFQESTSKQKYAEIIRADAADGDKLGVRATPTFFINGEKLEGVPSSYEKFKQLVEEKLK
jgi:protein-disulfide isomerase